MIPITHADGRAEQKLLRQLKARSGEVDRKVTAAVTAILDNVRQNGDRAVENYTLQFDGQMPEHILVERPEMEAALDQCDSKFVYALYQAAANIRDFHERQKRQSFLNTLDNGVILGQRVRGLKRVGLYVLHARHIHDHARGNRQDLFNHFQAVFLERRARFHNINNRIRKPQ